MGVYKNNNGTLQPIAGRGGALIDDTLTTTSNTWSASKMNNTFVTDANYTHTDNNYTNAEKSKLDSVATGAEVNVQADWEVTDNTSDAYIKNKPTIPNLGSGSGRANSLIYTEDITEITSAMYQAIQNGTFDGIHVGMKYTAPSGRQYYFAHADYWLHCGDTECTTHHMLVIPDIPLDSDVMNPTNTTSGAYIGSALKSSSTLNNVKQMIITDFGNSHILTHREYFANAVSNGKQSAGAWYDSDVDLMNEEMVYGCPIFTPANDGTTAPYNYTTSKSQLALFANRPDLITIRANWWLRDVVSIASFAFVDGKGYANFGLASYSLGVRPVFAIC